MCRPVLAVLLVLSAALLGAATVGAQDASPAAPGVVPDGSECTVVPRSQEEVRVLAAAALEAPDAATPSADPSPVAGEPADPAIVAAVSAAIREFYACQNAGDYLALLALHTDDATGQTVVVGLQVAADQGDAADRETSPAALLDAYVSILANPGEDFTEYLQVALLDIRRVTVLADGRIAAVAEIGPPSAESRRRRTEERFEFVVRNGRYLIDGPDESAGTGTPTP